jgi:hypothetical protein
MDLFGNAMHVLKTNQVFDFIIMGFSEQWIFFNRMNLSAEQNYTQKLEELIREKTKCNIWNREKYEEIIHLISTEPKNEDKTNFYYYIIKK